MALLQSLPAVIPLESHNLLALPLLAALLLIALLVVIKPKRSTRRKLNLPPGPPPLPLIGNLHQLGRMPNVSLHKLAQRYGPILHLTLGRIPTVIVSSSRLALEVLRTHDLQLASRPAIYAAKYLCYGCTDVGFAPYGAYWRTVRKLCVVQLLSAKRVESYAAHRRAEVERMVAEAAAGKTVNMSQAMKVYANGVVCRAAFGKDFAEGGEYKRRGFEEMLHDFQVLLGGFHVGDFYPSLEWINALTGTARVLRRTSQRFDRLLGEVIQEHLERRRGENGVRAEEERSAKDLVDVMLDAQMNGGGDQEISITTDNIKAVIMDMFAAGTDTVAITVDWAMTELIMNPEAMKKVQNEIRNVVGEKNTMVYENDLQQMHYLKAVIKETLRLHPPGPLLLPRESMDDVVIDGYNIPAKTRIFINVWAIGREVESWENPEEFQPERFLGSSIEYRGHDFKFLPFGSGRRICPGITFGEVGVEIVLAQLLHSFDWELPPGTEVSDLDLTEIYGAPVHKKTDLVLVAKPRYV